jgi:hypothetical protein
MQTPGTYLHHTVSMVRLPDLDLLIFHGTCTGTLVSGSFQKKIILFVSTFFFKMFGIFKKLSASTFNQGHSTSTSSSSSTRDLNKYNILNLLSRSKFSTHTKLSTY